MAVTSNTPRMRLHPIDDAVQALQDNPIYSKGIRSQQMSPTTRKKDRSDRARSRITYDLPEELINSIEAIARVNFTSQSGIAIILLLKGLEAFSKGDIDVASNCLPSRSVRFDQIVIQPKIAPVFIKGKIIYPRVDKSLLDLPDESIGDDDGRH